MTLDEYVEELVGSALERIDFETILESMEGGGLEFDPYEVMGRICDVKVVFDD